MSVCVIVACSVVFPVGVLQQLLPCKVNICHRILSSSLMVQKNHTFCRVRCFITALSFLFGAGKSYCWLSTVFTSNTMCKRHWLKCSNSIRTRSLMILFWLQSVTWKVNKRMASINCCFSLSPSELFTWIISWQCLCDGALSVFSCAQDLSLTYLHAACSCIVFGHWSFHTKLFVPSDRLLCYPAWPSLNTTSPIYQQLH